MDFLYEEVRISSCEVKYRYQYPGVEKTAGQVWGVSFNRILFFQDLIHHCAW